MNKRNFFLERFISASGAVFLVRKMMTRGKRFVLVFHGVSTQHYKDVPTDIQPYLDQQDLEYVLRWIGKRFAFLSPQDFFESDKPGVLVTFDDGLANNHDVALPILKQLGIPAVFFVCTQHVIDPKNWLHYFRKMAKRQWGDRAQKDPVAAECYDGLSPEKLRACVSSGLVTVGSHTVSHPVLADLSEAELWHEVAESKAFLEKNTAQPVDFFAFPAGVYDRHVTETVRKAGYRAAFAEDSKELGLPAFEIPRIGIYSADPGYLSLKLSGLYKRPITKRYFNSI